MRRAELYSLSIKNIGKFWLVGAFLIISLAACQVSSPDEGTTGLLTPTQEQRTFASPAEISPSPDSLATETVSIFSTNTVQAIFTPLPATTSTPPSVSLFPNPTDYQWRPLIYGLAKPVCLVNAGDGSGRLFVCEQDGIIRIVQEGQVLAEPFLDLRDRVGSRATEQGLLGLVFHPHYSENGFFYLNYTDHNGDTVIARFSVSPEPNQVDPNSEVRLLLVPQPYANHNGGAVVFGPDGYLYLGLGDGGSGGDPHGNAQSLHSLLGKILRIDVDTGDGYGIPPDNPFANGGGAPEIWAWGMRNPWRFSFDRLTGDLYIGDVGQGLWEEVDFLPVDSMGGANFGWNYREGAHPYQGSPPEGVNLVEPVAEYGHDLGYSITGGVVYRGEALPEWQGVYLYGDYVTGLVWGLLNIPGDGWQDAVLFQTNAQITTFGEDEKGEVYLVDHNGEIYRLERK